MTRVLVLKIENLCSLVDMRFYSVYFVYCNYNMNLAFYTYFYGSNNNSAFSIPKIPSLTYPCYYFTNNKLMLDIISKHTKWIGIYQDKPTTDDLIESCMIGKHVKVCPYEYDELKDYDYLCYLDSKLDHVKESFVEEFVTKYFIEQNYAILIRKHPFLPGCVWTEYVQAMQEERYVLQSEKYVRYINSQKKKGLEETYDKIPHCACGFIIRNMKHEKLHEICDMWYSNIQECGIQDQIPFFFVRQLYSEYIYPFAEWPFV